MPKEQERKEEEEEEILPVVLGAALKSSKPSSYSHAAFCRVTCMLMSSSLSKKVEASEGRREVARVNVCDSSAAGAGRGVNASK